jgi:hypothetical protein
MTHKQKIKITQLQLKIRVNIIKGLRTRIVELDDDWSPIRCIAELENGVITDRMNEIYQQAKTTALSPTHKNYKELQELSKLNGEYESKYLNF